MHVLAWVYRGGAVFRSALPSHQMQSAWDNQTSAQSVIQHHSIIPHTAFWLSVGRTPVLLLPRFPSGCDFTPRVCQVCFPTQPLSHVWMSPPLVSLQDLDVPASVRHWQTMCGFNCTVSRCGSKSFL